MGPPGRGRWATGSAVSYDFFSPAFSRKTVLVSCINDFKEIRIKIKSVQLEFRFLRSYDGVLQILA